jgi:hypothetical protein
MKAVPLLPTQQDTQILRLLMQIYIKLPTDKTRWPFDDDCLLGPSIDRDLYLVVANRNKVSYKLVRLQKLCTWLRRIGQDKLAGAIHTILEAEIRCTHLRVPPLFYKILEAHSHFSCSLNRTILWQMARRTFLTEGIFLSSYSCYP